jgi:hypothetical protein
MVAGTDNRRTAPATRRVIGLFAAAWVSLALQPCAIAAPSEHDCPHCPEEAGVADADAHHHHGADEAASADLSPTCSTAQADCCELDEGIVNLRTATIDLDDEPPALLADAPFPGSVVRADREPGNATGPPPPAESVPIHVRHCVYLK